MTKKRACLLVLLLVLAAALCLGGFYLYKSSQGHERPVHGILVLREIWGE
ncbi:hypothetical protein [Wansuia hejianensis]|uniref:Uncharacterized protein n=1 Tax=Wansuia hejianensis TaxID=2763667 RepID=A0A7G9G9V7_9FIRM|nr:hypothetical protein [Wansuia hejianensis]QNM07589.1 hypothetical protein H9Q79_11715 [Wansuia hejianensis]